MTTPICTAYGEECQHWYREDDKCFGLALAHADYCWRHGGYEERDSFTAEHETDDCCPVHHEEDETIHLIDGIPVREAA